MRKALLVAILAIASSAFGQVALPVREGLIQYVEGHVLLDQQPVDPSLSQLPQVEKGQTVVTEAGRAEVLLIPGVLLRVDQNSSFRVVSKSPGETRVEILSGSVIVEVREDIHEDTITLQCGGAAIRLKTPGLYRFDSAGGGRLRVYTGTADATSDGHTITAGTGFAVDLSKPLAAKRFDPVISGRDSFSIHNVSIVPADEKDSFYRWSESRAGFMATGLIQYVEGRVLLDGQEVVPKIDEFPHVENGGTLSTEGGRVEILLTQGAFLRLAENSSFRMASNNLSDTRLGILSGSAILEVDELPKDNAITLESGDTTISLKKPGLYRFDVAGGGRLRVYDGEAEVASAGRTITLKKGRAVKLGRTLAVAKFNTDDTDPFYRWSQRRAGYVATANMFTAGSFLSGGSLYGCGLDADSSWTFNPWFGMWTFAPCGGYGYSPFGYVIYSRPSAIVSSQFRSPLRTQASSYNPVAAPRTISPPTARAVAERDPGFTGTSGFADTGGSPNGGGGGGGGGTTVSVNRAAPSPSAAPASVSGARGR